MAKHIYDLKPLKQGTAPLFHVVTDGIVVSTHRTETAARARGGNKAFHKVVKQEAPSGWIANSRVERYGGVILTTLP